MSVTPITARAVLLASVALVVACSGAGNAPSPSPTPTRSPTSSQPPTASPTGTPAPTPSPSGSPAAGVIATFEVGDETYRVKIIDPAQIEIAQKLLAGEEAPSIPNGRIVRGDADVNTGWSWHIDPDDFEFADMTIELCDGLPSYVEDGSLSGERFCPWSAELVELEPAP